MIYCTTREAYTNAEQSDAKIFRKEINIKCKKYQKVVLNLGMGVMDPSAPPTPTPQIRYSSVRIEILLEGKIYTRRCTYRFKNLFTADGCAG